MDIRISQNGDSPSTLGDGEMTMQSVCKRSSGHIKKAKLNYIQNSFLIFQRYVKGFIAALRQ